jgi:predicted unusual protein kinase regulating ubiquinone biosynthesis (AarF/ABC1/UbiB family)
MKKRISVRKRSRKAFRLANQLLFSYFFLFISKKIVGRKYFDSRINKAHTKNAKRVKATILELQGLFTKAGQLISTLSHILPDQYMDALESLQDNAPSSKFSETKAFIEQELGAPIPSIFSEFNETPIASASIGQVYRAKLKSGEDVAVKVQHQNIELLAKADLGIIKRLIKRVSFFIQVQGMEHVYDQVEAMIEDELDYEREAESMQIIAKNLDEVNGIRIPKVFSDFSSTRILITQFEQGVKITNVTQLDNWNIDRKELMERLILVYCKMILEDGFYHADPHPGNILVNENSEIILLDFGAVAILSKEMREEIPILIQAVIQKNQEKILLSLRKLGFIGNDRESEKIAQQLIAALSQFVQSEVKIDSMNFKDLNFEDLKGTSLDNLRKDISLKELTKTIRIPKDWILLDRTLQLLTGTSSTVAKELNPMDVIKPYLKKLVLKDGGLKKIIVDAIKQQLTTLISIPSDISSFLKKANKGELEVTIKTYDSRMYALGQQGILTLFILASLYFYQTSGNNYTLIPSALLSILLLRSIWKHRKS